ncbi:MAG TPA: OsmC family protein [Polyangiales bacterium]|nr:OsmC family protein [Polyangiales bacterium]
MLTVARTEPEDRTLNGLDPEELARAAGDIVENPAIGQTTFRARTQWQGRLRSRTEIDNYDLGGQRIPRRHTIHSDEPIELLGADQAPNPQDLLLAALNACMMVGFVVGATHAGLRIDSLEIESECALDLRGAFGLDPNVPPGAEKIRYAIKVKGNGTVEQFEQVHSEMMSKSPNRYHITAPIPLESTLVVL